VGEGEGAGLIVGSKEGASVSPCRIMVEFVTFVYVKLWLVSSASSKNRRFFLDCAWLNTGNIGCCSIA